MTRDTTHRAGRAEGPRHSRRNRAEPSSCHENSSNCDHSRLSSYIAQPPPPPTDRAQTESPHERSGTHEHNSTHVAEHTHPPPPPTSHYNAIRNQIGQASFLPDFPLTNRLSAQNCRLTGGNVTHPVSVNLDSARDGSFNGNNFSRETPLVQNLPAHNNLVPMPIQPYEPPLPQPYTLPDLPHPLSTGSGIPCHITQTPIPPVVLDSRGPLAEQSSLNEMISCLSHPLCVPHDHTVRRRRRHRRHRHRSRRHRSQRRHQRTEQTEEEETRKCCSCLSCKICLSTCLQFQKVLIFFASFGIVCIITGVILGVLRSPGNSFVTLSLMFAGLGLILLVMVLVGWKCTPADHEPCHMLFGLGVYATVGSRGRRRRERLYWLGGMLYPEFRNRRPPPSYAAAMQERRNDLRRRSSHHIPGSPPPSYKSHASVLDRAGIHIIFPRGEDFPDSNPPTYRITEPWSRPSLASFVESFTAQDESGVRESVSSTQVLVEAEYTGHYQGSPTPEPSPVGVVNPSFETNSPNDRTPESDSDAVFTPDGGGSAGGVHQYEPHEPDNNDNQAMQLNEHQNNRQRADIVVIDMEEPSSSL